MSQGERLLKELEAALSSHDWFYQYSDDYRSWSAGEKHKDLIDSLMIRLTAFDLKDKARALYDEYRKKSGHSSVKEFG